MLISLFQVQPVSDQVVSFLWMGQTWSFRSALDAADIRGARKRARLRQRTWEVQSCLVHCLNSTPRTVSNSDINLSQTKAPGILKETTSCLKSCPARVFRNPHENIANDSCLNTGLGTTLSQTGLL